MDAAVKQGLKSLAVAGNRNVDSNVAQARAIVASRKVGKRSKKAAVKSV